PRRVAVRVGQIAYQELVDDIKGRRHFYKQLGREEDATVAERESPEEFFKRLGLPENPNDPRREQRALAPVSGFSLRSGPPPRAGSFLGRSRRGRIAHEIGRGERGYRLSTERSSGACAKKVIASAYSSASRS